MKTLSICIPTFNRCDILKQNLMELISSENMDFEIVVSDDASTDETFAMVKQINDNRIKYFKNDINYGAAYNMHLSFLRATAKFMLLVSDEDVIDNDSLDYIVSLLKTENPVAYIGSGDRGEDLKIFEDEIFENRGYDILKKYGFNIRYMSGIIMNVKKYKHVVGDISFMESGELFNSYSFLYGLTKLFFEGKVIFDSKKIYKQIKFAPTRKSNNSPNTPNVYYFEPAGRLDQMNCYIKQVSKLNMTIDEKIDVAINLIYDQTHLCFRVFDRQYLKKLKGFIEPEDFKKLCCHISGLDIKGIIDSMYCEAIDSIIEEFDLDSNYKIRLINDERLKSQKDLLYSKAEKLMEK